MPRSRAEQLEMIDVILQQLGGMSRLTAMIGARDFRALDGVSVGFRFAAKARNGANYVRVRLDPSDTYSVFFLSVRGMNIKPKGEYSDIYAEDLKRLIEDKTGLRLSL